MSPTKLSDLSPADRELVLALMAAERAKRQAKVLDDERALAAAIARVAEAAKARTP
jgi:hypothetical protein